MAFLEDYRGKQHENGSWRGERGCMAPYFPLALFAGIRPDYKDGEITKLRPEHIRLDTNVILIEPEVSKVNVPRSSRRHVSSPEAPRVSMADPGHLGTSEAKTKRAIKIQPNLRLWLEKYPTENFPIIPKRRFRDMWIEVRSRFELPHDALRHTYISMTVGAFRSVVDASFQAGYSKLVIRRHYLDLKSVEEADAFWGIVPKGARLPEKLVKEDGGYLEA